MHLLKEALEVISTVLEGLNDIARDHERRLVELEEKSKKTCVHVPVANYWKYDGEKYTTECKLCGEEIPYIRNI